ncbi:unnamed protein product [Thlaspi arvense]|uniref:Neprosin PEP catalytic domain-containing protein n=1 Tax=Thlaspi arvense TaxID=13288 RepID=A0AAU9T5C8_THLAR|nr:unnamed protein product [Thlaspi arvense]
MVFATTEYRYYNFGAKVNLSIWEPEVSPTQFSSESLLMADGSKEQFQGIRAGWIADGFIKTGCYNLLCPGFVQVSKRIPLDILLQHVSTYGGEIFDVGISIYKEGNTRNWWLVVYDEKVGYWPNSLFTQAGLAHGASLLSYGGEVYSPVNEKATSMGSGHFPSEGYKKAAYVNGLRVVNNHGDLVFWKPLFHVTLFSSNPNCYKVKKKRGRHSEVWEEAVALILVAEGHRKILLEEDEKELERLLNYINKPAIKSFQTEHGDILDCIDIHKQLAFDHPLLKNHTIQLRPTTIPKWTINNSQKGGSLPFLQDGISCPNGTVVVKRTTHEDLIQAQRLKSMGFNYARYVSSEGTNIDLTGFHFSVGEYKYTHYGAKGNLNLWEPEVSPTQFSAASMLIAKGAKEKFQCIRAGWIVYQWLNRNHTRLYTYWTADGFTKTGCYNLLCPGFVQVSTKIPLGFLLQPVSTYGGQQYELEISIYEVALASSNSDHLKVYVPYQNLSPHDGKTEDWWLVVFGEHVGYWPNSLFTEGGLSHGASLASYGGEVYSPLNEKTPSMGSGHFPSEGYHKAAYVNGIEVVYDIGGTASRPPLYTIKTSSSTPNCYISEMKPNTPEVWLDALFYGGPGVNEAAQDRRAILSEEEKKKMQLKAINKPAIKSFKTENGDIFDCIDIHKQLAFDHPLLKNHSVQLPRVTEKYYWKRMKKSWRDYSTISINLQSRASRFWLVYATRITFIFRLPQTEHGDILDCIYIHKQLAFDHPLLNNHTIQLRPTTIPKWTINNHNNSQKGGSLPFLQDGISCPNGTVAVKRTTHEDLIQDQRLKSMGFNYAKYVSSESRNIDLTGFHFAVGEYKYHHYGAKGNLNVWEPEVSPTQFSAASMLIAKGAIEDFQCVRAGWIVYQWLNRNHTRLYTYWTADGFTKTGCYNLLCPGFVQVSTKIPLGFLLQPVSTYGGQQYELGISIYKVALASSNSDHLKVYVLYQNLRLHDGKTGDWWLVVFEEHVGYWPNSLFTEGGLSHVATLASYGGEVYSPLKEKTPSMGSGHFPSEGYTKAAYVNGIEVVDDIGGTASRPPMFTVKTSSSTPKCYKSEKKPGTLEVWYDAFFYGGPGGCTS